VIRGLFKAETLGKKQSLKLGPEPFSRRTNDEPAQDARGEEKRRDKKGNMKEKSYIVHLYAVRARTGGTIEGGAGKPPTGLPSGIARPAQAKLPSCGTLLRPSESRDSARGRNSEESPISGR